MPINIGYEIPPYWGWTAYTPVIPKLYWDVYSQEERIKRLCIEYDKLTHYVSMIASELNDFSNDVDDQLSSIEAKIEEQLNEQNDKISEMIAEQNKLVENKLDEMQKYIDSKFDTIAEGMEVYDVTTGAYRPSIEAMRRLFQALSYDHKEEEQLVSFYADNKTVEDMATQTVYNVAYSNLPSVVIDDQLQRSN